MVDSETQAPARSWNTFFKRRKGASPDEMAGVAGEEKQTKAVWNMGMLNDKETIEVPGSVLLLAQGRNEPLGLRNAPARTSHSSLPAGFVPEAPTPPPVPAEEEKKMTADGQIILEPQPDDSHNDPLNWPAWRRDSALLSLGLYCMVGGGITPILAAGFTNVAEDYNIDVAEVSLTTGLYMLGLGIGCVIFSPTAILYGKRPVYLFSSILFIISAVWCALSPNFTSLILARIFQGIAVSPVECLPSATIAEIFFLHERAYRIGVYTLLLLGGKNLVPLVSAVVIQSLGWRWVFWIVAIVVAFCGALLFLLVPETFWDRSPVPRARNQPKRPGFFSRRSSRHRVPGLLHANDGATSAMDQPVPSASGEKFTEDHVGTAKETQHRHKNVHVGFAPAPEDEPASPSGGTATGPDLNGNDSSTVAEGPSTAGYFHDPEGQPAYQAPGMLESDAASEKMSVSSLAPVTKGQVYTHNLRQLPAKSFTQQLKLHHGRLNQDKWWKAAIRPLILYSYPSVLWSAAIYACSVGWLIVISESVAIIFRQGTYKFSALATGLVYISPFIGGVLGTAVAGKVSDIIVKAMARRNGGLYEPEFRLVMAAPVAVTTVIGLMGFGWSAQVKDAWIVPTIFFGVVSFGCALGSTTAITFCVDSYRQYAGEALVTLNFSKNIFHGLVFSLFVTEWLTHDGSKSVFIWIGIIQLIVLVSTIPMYIYGKRARMWTVRRNFMEKF
ncbi:Uu.00g113030.m01.CDS01 [Anthostomella pinea]|uniref:Uu.00g113030.m01.CDS01 n=1 Tax=Anthostomella pinea TaxID=933095 RepID=A0AAI8VGG1_9PEZI|nr:Uu.00g113030.m01.CDS01 [Anthostomella pinea]